MKIANKRVNCDAKANYKQFKMYPPYSRDIMTLQTLQTLSHILVLIGVVIGGVGAFGSYFYSQAISNLPIINLKIESIESPEWSNSTFYDYSLSNMGKGVLTVLSSKVKVISIESNKKLRVIQQGAPQIPLKAKVYLHNKVGSYKISYVSESKKFYRLILKENDIDYIKLKIGAVDGFDYEIKLAIDYRLNSEDNVYSIESENIKIQFPISDLEKAINSL
jgi:hypothetical protein